MSLQYTAGWEETRLPVELGEKQNQPLPLNKTMYFFDWLTVRSKKSYKNYTCNLKNKTLCKLNLHRGQGTGKVPEDQAGNRALYCECQASISFCMSAACDNAVALEKIQLLPSPL